MQILLIEAILVLFLICVTVAIMTDADMFACTILFGAFSFCAVLTYLIFGSPDVAFTEAVIGTMSTVFYAVALRKVDRKTVRGRIKLRGAKKAFDVHRRRRSILTFAVILTIAAGFCYCSKYLPAIGDPDSPPNTHVSNYYIEHSEEDTASANVVSGTLADYRGYDTMFETSVMFVSGLVVTLILYTGDKQLKEKKRRFNEQESADDRDEG